MPTAERQATSFPWPKCRRRHDMTDPTNVYIDPHGRRHCRTCKRQQQRTSPPRPRPVRRGRPKQYANWAEHAWAQMTERDRFLVRSALLEMELPE